mmetsp:Transcript_36049/g.75879  ORF Transcript_36049/g.75879 Transcript_36049/m.75879 type:complete len:241 (+) Transcript_36049:818-1540(+)
MFLIIQVHSTPRAEHTAGQLRGTPRPLSFPSAAAIVFLSSHFFRLQLVQTIYLAFVLLRCSRCRGGAPAHQLLPYDLLAAQMSGWAVFDGADSGRINFLRPGCHVVTIFQRTLLAMYIKRPLQIQSITPSSNRLLGIMDIGIIGHLGGITIRVAVVLARRRWRRGGRSIRMMMGMGGSPLLQQRRCVRRIHGMQRGCSHHGRRFDTVDDGWRAGIAAARVLRRRRFSRLPGRIGRIARWL